MGLKTPATQEVETEPEKTFGTRYLILLPTMHVGNIKSLRIVDDVTFVQSNKLT
jgi:hypothetical protein